MDFDRAAEIIGDRGLLEELRRLSIAIYELGAEHARERGIILADTKFEFGRRADGTIVLGDEVLTPDSSRFWPADGYEPGHGQPSFDKQYVRDWASGSGWDKTPPAPALPGRRDRAHARAVRGGVRAHRRRAVRGLAGALRLRARVLIRPKEGILDPQGQAVERALPALGFDGVQNVHVGRLIELDVEDASQVPQMCERLLANPLIEDYEVVEDVSRHEVRRRPLPGLLRRGRRAAGVPPLRRRRAALARRPRPAAASTPWSSPAASPTATTCAWERSRASRR